MGLKLFQRLWEWTCLEPAWKVYKKAAIIIKINAITGIFKNMKRETEEILFALMIINTIKPWNWDYIRYKCLQTDSLWPHLRFLGSARGNRRDLREVILLLHEPFHLICNAPVSLMGWCLIWLHCFRVLIICFSESQRSVLSISSCNVAAWIQTFILLVYSCFSKTERVNLSIPNTLRHHRKVKRSRELTLGHQDTSR